MSEQNTDGYMQVNYPIDAVTPPKFAELIGKTPAAVQGMIEKISFR